MPQTSNQTIIVPDNIRSRFNKFLRYPTTLAWTGHYQHVHSINLEYISVSHVWDDAQGIWSADSLSQKQKRSRARNLRNNHIWDDNQQVWFKRKGNQKYQVVGIDEVLEKVATTYIECHQRRAEFVYGLITNKWAGITRKDCREAVCLFRQSGFPFAAAPDLRADFRGPQHIQIDDNRHLLLSSPHIIPTLRKEIRALLNDAPEDSRGMFYSERMLEILSDTQAVKIHIPGTQSDSIRASDYEIVGRERAHVLLLNELQASDELKRGPHDGKPILIHGSTLNEPSPEATLLWVLNYGLNELQVQDPTSKDLGTVPFSRAEIVKQLRRVIAGTTVGYQPGEVPPYNLLDLPCNVMQMPNCLTANEETMVHYFLRVGSSSEASRAARSACWNLLCVHLASSLPHQDHDGLGTHALIQFGYKVWILWPDMTSEAREKFAEQGICFNGPGSRYLILGPGDQYIQSPAVSQDIHAVLSFGYCNITECNGNCQRWGYPRCKGLIGTRGMHFWHRDFMDDSLQAALNELHTEEITNEKPHADFVNLMRMAEKLMNRHSSEWRTNKTRFKALKKVGEVSFHEAPTVD